MDALGAEDSKTQTPAMRELFERAARVAPSESTILVTGETGVGKERLARWLHEHSQRAGRKFVPVNCGAIPDTLLDTQLFGHTRGAFTGAVHESIGMFEAASGGTLFLDEIGEVSPAMQSKLLRVLQERQVQRVGEWQLRPVDVRLIAATNRNLEDEVALGRFRKDLLYRLRVVKLHIPPLRERLGDLWALARDLLQREAARHQRPVKRVRTPGIGLSLPIRLARECARARKCDRGSVPDGKGFGDPDGGPARHRAVSLRAAGAAGRRPFKQRAAPCGSRAGVH